MKPKSPKLNSTTKEWLKTSKKLLKDLESIPAWRVIDTQTLDIRFYQPDDGDWHELDVVQKALEHFVEHLEGTSPCPDSVPVYIVSKEKGKRLEKSGKARRM